MNSVTMLDSLYDEHGLDSWIHQNIADLSKGTKHYVTFSMSQLQDIAKSSRGLLQMNCKGTTTVKPGEPTD